MTDIQAVLAAHGMWLRGELGSTRADLRRANLRGADLTGAHLTGANLTDADTLALARTIITPEGELVGWKRAGEHIVKLRIPAEARRSNATGRKCRAEWVEALEIHPPAEVAVTQAHGPRTEYRVGSTVRADSWDEDRWVECSHGIHFFLTREEAVAWT